MKNTIILTLLFLGKFSYNEAQTTCNSNRPDKYYCDNRFDWHWDVRVRISEGSKTGLLSPSETNNLFYRLRDIEMKEYNYQSDGYYSSFEQQRIWDDVVYLNHKIGIDLQDCDRNFYGFDACGVNRRGFGVYFDRNNCDFNRFDKRGFGSIQYGYSPRNEYQNSCNRNNNYQNSRYEHLENERLEQKREWMANRRRNNVRYQTRW
ncbi:MAG: hypothetical protein KA313_02255 [Pseudarcicella sp.]|nr:hypothetical protein [Pseudarcicella sp.]MBP6409901.1 hypothetical protein [Pseudarcicella sp.]